MTFEEKVHQNSTCGYCQSSFSPNNPPILEAVKGKVYSGKQVFLAKCYDVEKHSRKGVIPAIGVVKTDNEKEFMEVKYSDWENAKEENQINKSFKKKQ